MFWMVTPHLGIGDQNPNAFQGCLIINSQYIPIPFLLHLCIMVLQSFDVCLCGISVLLKIVQTMKAAKYMKHLEVGDK